MMTSTSIGLEEYNINASATESLGYYEMKQHKPVLCIIRSKEAG